RPYANLASCVHPAFKLDLTSNTALRSRKRNLPLSHLGKNIDPLADIAGQFRFRIERSDGDAVDIRQRPDQVILQGSDEAVRTGREYEDLCASSIPYVADV